MSRWLRSIPVLLVLDVGSAAAAAELETIETRQTFDALVERVEQAVQTNDMIVVTRACASCGAAKRGVEIPGNMVLGVFRNDFAVRMLEASVPAGVEAPIRFYVTETEDGADLHWKAPSRFYVTETEQGDNLHWLPPSVVFEPYDGPGLDELASELDGIYEKIAVDATE
ncbi:MAG: DUF302 domain-containing protein [Geminicoccaceae bacterium]|nr:DUF302 domain-containing protein [Geminicoccaceae bacterium]